jgi:O-antigen/teichoic acid export membrane protein
MQSVATLTIVAVLLGLPAAIYSMRHPRSKGEPFSNQRRVLLALAVLGAVLLIISAILLLSPS